MIFLTLIISEKNVINEVNIFSQCLYYFIIQSFCSIIFLLVVSFDTLFFYNIFMIIVIILKLGVSPFFFWVFKICNYLSSFMLFFILNFQKIPLLFFFFSFDPRLIMSFIIFNMFVGAILLLKRKRLVEFLVSSRVCFFNWFFFCVLWSILGLVLFFFKYIIFNFNFVGFKKFIYFYEIRTFFFLKIIITITFLIGVPPLIFFFYKFYILKSLSQLSRFNFVLISWIFSLICIICYFNFFFFLIINKENFYRNNFYLKNNDYILLVSSSFCSIMFF